MSQPLQFVSAFPNLTFSNPIFLTHSNDGTNRILCCAEIRINKIFPNDSNVTTSKTFLDVTNLNNGSTYQERGLLGLAFHPNYANNGYFIFTIPELVTEQMCFQDLKRSLNDPDKARLFKRTDTLGCCRSLFKS